MYRNSFTDISATFCNNICRQELLKIAQSGRADCLPGGAHKHYRLQNGHYGESGGYNLRAFLECERTIFSFII